MPPPIIHACHESRVEAQKHYKLVAFDNRLDESQRSQVWYGPSIDIVYLGDNTCIMTLLFLERRNIPRIAINSTRKYFRMIQCCDLDDGWKGMYAKGVPGGVDPLQAMHGFRERETCL
jgi:hypothetical protein